jgi:hypothetical protein
MRLRFTTASQVFDAFPSARDGVSAAITDAHPLVYVKQLHESAMPEEAIAFCAYMLPRREAVQWACQCVRGMNPEIEGEAVNLISIAEQWVEVPEEENRLAAMEAGTAAVNSGPAAWCALAAGWSGGSLIGEPHQPVPPAPDLTAQLVRAAILTALAFVPPKQRQAQLSSAVRAAVSLVE